MKKFILPILFCITNLTFGQSENEEIEFPAANRSYLTFDIFTPIDFVAPRYRFGYIHSLDENWRIGADLGFGSEGITWKRLVRNDNDNYLLAEIRFEVYHIINPTKRVNLYISGETYFIRHTEVYYNGEYEPEDQVNNILYDKADFKREKYGFNLKFGVMVPFGEHVGMNAYVGAGPRVRGVSFSNLVNPIEVTDYYDDDDSWGTTQYKNEGTVLGFNFALGVKFFYVLK